MQTDAEQIGQAPPLFTPLGTNPVCRVPPIQVFYDPNNPAQAVLQPGGNTRVQRFMLGAAQAERRAQDF